MNYVTDKAYTPADIENGFEFGEYENCHFNRIILTNSDISGYKFIDCQFTACDLSNARMDNTAFNNCSFEDCKILGSRYDRCEGMLLEFRFKNCLLDHTSFYQLKIKQTVFIDCSLKGADFTECDLSSAVFKNCNLENATFDHTKLGKADFSTAYNYNIDPEQNSIKKAVFSAEGLIGLLNKYDIKIKS